MSPARTGWAGRLVAIAFACLAIAIVYLPVAALAVDGAVVKQAGRHFAVEAVRIGRGGTVRFVNADDFDHQVYIQSNTFSFDSDEQSPGETVSVTFPSEGVFVVRCHIHPKMHLSVTVSDGP